MSRQKHFAPPRPRRRRRRMSSSTGSRRLPADQPSSFHPRHPPRIIVVIVANTIDYYDDEASLTPSRQDVTFLAPVGLENWTPSMTELLGYLLPMLCTPPILVTSNNHVTPAIRIWHNKYENITWDPVDDSFGMGGADGLWRVGPFGRDILDAIDGSRVRGNDGDGEDDVIVLHTTLEAGACSAGGGMDTSPFFDAYLMKRVVIASVEPIAFPDAGAVSHEDALAMKSLVDGIEASLTASSSHETKTNGGGRRRKLLVVSPDWPCHDALVSYCVSACRWGVLGRVVEAACEVREKMMIQGPL